MVMLWAVHLHAYEGFHFSSQATQFSCYEKPYCQSCWFLGQNLETSLNRCCFFSCSIAWSGPFAQNGIVDILVPLQEFFMQSRITWFELLHLSKVEWCHSDIVKSIKWRGIPAQGLKWFQMKLLVALSSGTKEHSYTSYKLHVVIGKLNVRILGINLLLKSSSFS